MKVEKHPGPFMGPDAELARACAMAVIPFYGNDDEVTHQRIMNDGVWNDHVAVQAALAAIHHLKQPDGWREERERCAQVALSLRTNESATWDGACEGIAAAILLSPSKEKS